jgi:tight adherence protein B
MAFLLALLTFLAVAVIFLGLWLSLGADTRQETVRRRVEAVRKAERRGGGNIPLDLQLVRDELLSTVPILNRVMMRFSLSGKFRDFLAQSGLKAKPGKILLLACVIGLGTYLLAGYFVHQFLVPITAGFLGAAVPFAVVAFLRRRRLRKFEEHFPEALDLLGRAVRAGHAFTTGLEMVAKDSAEPIAGEFRTTFEEQNFGLPLRDSLLNMVERVPNVDVRFFVTALMVQKETGGNLAEILDELSRVIRERFRIYRDVRVKTAQGRLTAMILILLPIAMFFALQVINPDYTKVLFKDPLGPPILAGAAILQVIGSIILWKIIHIEV